MAFERDTLHPGCIFELLNDNQNTLAAVAMKYADGQNWEEDSGLWRNKFSFPEVIHRTKCTDKP